MLCYVSWEGFCRELAMGQRMLGVVTLRLCTTLWLEIDKRGPAKTYREGLIFLSPHYSIFPFPEGPSFSCFPYLPTTIQAIFIQTSVFSFLSSPNSLYLEKLLPSFVVPIAGLNPLIQWGIHQDMRWTFLFCFRQGLMFTELTQADNGSWLSKVGCQRLINKVRKLYKNCLRRPMSVFQKARLIQQQQFTVWGNIMKSCWRAPVLPHIFIDFEPCFISTKVVILRIFFWGLVPLKKLELLRGSA